MALFRKSIIVSIIASAPVLLSGCNDDDTDINYKPWAQENTEFVEKAEAETKDGVKVYHKLAPSWAPEAFTLVKWETDPALTVNNLSPMDNSIVYVKYDVNDIYGNRIDDSYSSKTYGDSIYRTSPNKNVTGFWYTLTQMHVGDSVTAILPAVSGYGNSAQGSVPPYSTLVFHIKLVGIPAFEVPM